MAKPDDEYMAQVSTEHAMQIAKRLMDVMKDEMKGAPLDENTATTTIQAFAKVIWIIDDNMPGFLEAFLHMAQRSEKDEWHGK